MVVFAVPGYKLLMPLLEHRWFCGKGGMYPQRFEQYREASPDLRALYASTIATPEEDNVYEHDTVAIKCKDEVELRAHFERNIQGPLSWGDDKKLRLYYVDLVEVAGGLDVDDEDV